MHKDTPAERLAQDLDAVSAAAAMLPTDPFQVEDLVDEAIALLNMEYGMGNRHSVAVRDMLNTAIEAKQGEKISADFCFLW